MGSVVSLHDDFQALEKSRLRGKSILFSKSLQLAPPICILGWARCWATARKKLGPESLLFATQPQPQVRGFCCWVDESTRWFCVISCAGNAIALLQTSVEAGPALDSNWII